MIGQFLVTCLLVFFAVLVLCLIFIAICMIYNAIKDFLEEVGMRDSLCVLLVLVVILVVAFLFRPIIFGGNK